MQCPSSRGQKKVTEPAGEEEHALKSLKGNPSGIGVEAGQGGGENGCCGAWGMGWGGEGSEGGRRSREEGGRRDMVCIANASGTTDMAQTNALTQVVP
jgi:hypothetical protein